MRKPSPRKLPRFASRPPAPGGPARPERFARALEVLHKLLTGGAALAAILRFLF